MSLSINAIILLIQTNLTKAHKHKRRDFIYEPITASHNQSYPIMSRWRQFIHFGGVFEEVQPPLTPWRKHSCLKVKFLNCVKNKGCLAIIWGAIVSYVGRDHFCYLGSGWPTQPLPNPNLFLRLRTSTWRINILKPVQSVVSSWEHNTVCVVNQTDLTVQPTVSYLN